LVGYLPLIRKKCYNGCMRTPNTKCILCDKPLYRRPSDKQEFRYAACIKCRGEAQKVAGITKKQQRGLRLGRIKGTNHLEGIPKSFESKKKRAVSMALWCKTNPDKCVARAKNNKGAKHYRWKGGISNLNQSIRQLDKNRKWMDAVKARDGKCVICGSPKSLESHHIIPVAVIMEQYKITTREQAEECKALWLLSNGKTFCRKCHYKVHGRKYED
jgi:hypothetical protein